MEHDPSDIIMFRPPKETLNMIKDMTSIVSDSKVGKEINKSIDDLLNKDTSITSYSFTPQTKEWGKPYYSGKKKYDYRREIDKRIGIQSPGASKQSLSSALGMLLNSMNVLLMATDNKDVLGNEYLIKSGTCKNKKGKVIDKYTYVNNIPSGKLPGFGGTRGLVPGLIESVLTLPTDRLLKAFTKDNVVECFGPNDRSYYKY